MNLAGLHLHDADGDGGKDKQTPATKECRDSLVIFSEMYRDIVEGRGEEIPANKDCPICFSTKRFEQFLYLPCGGAQLHEICTDCAESWLSINNSCPICREKITSEAIQAVMLKNTELPITFDAAVGSSRAKLKVG